MKAYLRKCRALTHHSLDLVLHNALSSVTSSDCINWFLLLGIVNIFLNCYKKLNKKYPAHSLYRGIAQTGVGTSAPPQSLQRSWLKVTIPSVQHM